MNLHHHDILHRKNILLEEKSEATVRYPFFNILLLKKKIISKQYQIIFTANQQKQHKITLEQYI